MRICLLSREYPPDTGWGGIGTVMYHLGKGLSGLGHDVQVVSLTGMDGQGRRLAPSKGASRCGSEAGPVVHRVAPQKLAASGGLFNFLLPVTRPMLEETSALWLKLLELHKEKPFDVIECPEHFADGLFPCLARLAPAVVRLHTPHFKLVQERFHNFSPTFDHRVLSAMERVAMLTADVLVSPSEDLASFIAADLRIPIDEIRIVRNAVNEQQFSPEGNCALPSDGAPVVLFVGRLEARKGVHDLVRAVPAVVREFPNARFVLVGKDTETAPGHGSVKAELESVLGEHDCVAAVTFIEHVPLNELPSYYRSADICVLPSLYDNAPMTAIEAMSCGKPVVVSCAGGAKEYVLDGRCGLVVPPSDPASLADALIKLLRNNQLKVELGRNARERVLAELTWDKMVELTVQLYESAMARFALSGAHALYPGQAETLNDQLVSTIAALDTRLYEMMFSYSWRFRLRHWQRKAKELFLCK